MTDNHVYNLTLQLVQENKSLWRIKNHYMEDAGDCADCQSFWGKLIEDKEEHIDEIMGLLKAHLNA